MADLYGLLRKFDERVHEMPGFQAVLPNGMDVWGHDTEQVRAWLIRLVREVEAGPIEAGT